VANSGRKVTLLVCHRRLALSALTAFDCFIGVLVVLVIQFQHNSSASAFYPGDAMLARVIVIATCLSVCPSVRHAPVLCKNEES